MQCNFRFNFLGGFFRRKGRYSVKKAITFSALLLSLISFVPIAQAKKVQVTAKINSKCQSQPVKITVPRGKKAGSFKLKRLENGQKCKVGGKPDEKGFVIKKGSRVVYRWSQWRNKSKNESPVKLSKLVLGPGTYWVHVSGGRGAQATLCLHLR